MAAVPGWAAGIAARLPGSTNDCSEPPIHLKRQQLDHWDTGNGSRKLQAARRKSLPQTVRGR